MERRREFLKISFLAFGLVSLLGVATRAFAVTKKPVPAWNDIERECVVTCPVCNEGTKEIMSREMLKRVYHCPHCLTWLSPKKNDHCIYDSYGSVKCPQKQLKDKTPKA